MAYQKINCKFLFQIYEWSDQVQIFVKNLEVNQSDANTNSRFVKNLIKKGNNKLPKKCLGMVAKIIFLKKIF